MKLSIILLFVISVVYADNPEKPEEHPSEGNTNLREAKQNWQYVSPTLDNSGWVPHPLEEEQPLKRRRIRKRKRRPPVMREPWEEAIIDEEEQKVISRRRLTPVYEEKVRDPFTALQEAEEKQRKNAPDLKTLLKQSGSLSEVLQEKNLTLAELLKGDREAISALIRETETTTESVKSTEKYRRVPAGLRNSGRNGDLNSQEVVEAQKKRFSLLYGQKEIKTTTNKIEEKTESSTMIISQVRPGKRKLPITSAKLNKLGQQQIRIPENAVTISLDGVNIENDDNEPFKMMIDLNEMTTQTPSTETTSKVVETTTLAEKIKYVTAKEEIMEILKNPSERDELARILRKRNMTIEELVEQRERGSSQLHLADIFHNNTREPEPKEEPHVGRIESDNFESFPFYNRKGKTLSKNEPFLTTQQSIEKEISPKVPYTITSFPTYKIETNKDKKIQQLLPIWHELYPNLFPEGTNFLSSTTEKVSWESLETLEEIENRLTETSNGRLKSDLQEVDEEEHFINLPSGVKSAVLASLAIIGLSLVVFITILLIFKWSQKRKLKYNGSFASSKIKSPILQPNQRRTFKSFVSETLGKKKNYYKEYAQRMSDSIWDNNEKKPYMI